MTRTIFSFFFIASINSQSASEAIHLLEDEMGFGARSLSLGGAYTALGNDPSGMYWNPAGIGYTRIRNIYVNHSDWIADISFDYFSISVPLKNSHVLGINITSVTMGEIEVTRYGNEDT